VLAAIFGVVLVLVAVRWPPLAAVDQVVLDRVNGLTAARPTLVTVALTASFIGDRSVSTCSPPSRRSACT
jgi:hypothetical protein